MIGVLRMNPKAKKLAPRPNKLRQEGLSFGVTVELAGRPGSGETDTSLGPATRQDGATGFGTRARQETELTDTTFLGGLERSFHGKG